jgi:hypothetical protein
MQSMAIRITDGLNQFGRRCCALSRNMVDDLFVSLGLQNLAATVETVGADVMAQVRFAGRGFNRGGRVDQEIVRAVHATLGRGLLVLLNSHDDS